MCRPHPSPRDEAPSAHIAGPAAPGDHHARPWRSPVRPNSHALRGCSPRTATANNSQSGAKHRSERLDTFLAVTEKELRSLREQVKEALDAMWHMAAEGRCRRFDVNSPLDGPWGGPHAGGVDHRAPGAPCGGASRPAASRQSAQSVVPVLDRLCRRGPWRVRVPDPARALVGDAAQVPYACQSQRLAEGARVVGGRMLQ